jgi:serine/threonine protein kinase
MLIARKEHPGIVPIYNLGHDDGGPFYTMPFIEGRTLQEAIDAFHGEEAPGRGPGGRGLRLRELLQQFIAACNTVAYAHDRGVVHRDLKPSNLMLGPYGETLVMDWGLAKRFRPGAAASEGDGDPPSPGASPEAVTDTGEVVGTPRFMSPEQARGEPAGPAGDIFSPGLVLYAILTGQSAFDESSFRGADRLRAVREAALVPPRTRDPGLPRALEAICLKGLAARAGDRYPSARALGEDLARWLADEPVTAWREPLSLRARRWMRRHRSSVTAAVAALVAAVIGLAAVAAVQARANSELERAKSQIEKALARALAEEKAKGEALAQSEESWKQAEAESTFLVGAFRSPDPSQDGRQVKVADDLDRATERLDRSLAGTQATRGALLDTLGRTYFGLGLYDRAAGVFTNARAVREVALGPDHLDTLKSRNNLAAAHAVAGRTAEAIALHEATVRLRESKLGPDHPVTFASRNNLAIAYAAAGRPAEVIALHEGTLKLMESKLGPDHPITLVIRTNLAAAYSDAGRTAEALALDEGTLRLRESKLGPDHPVTLNSRRSIADAYQSIGRWAEAEGLYREVVRCRKAAAPDSPQLPDELVILGQVLSGRGRWSEAEPLLREAVAIRERATPDDWRRYHAMSLLSGALLGQGRHAEAEPSIVAGYEGTKAREARMTVPHRSRLRESAERVVRLYEGWGRPEQAAAWRAKLGMPDLPAEVFVRP